MKARKVFALFAAAVLALLLWGCQTQQLPEQSTQPTETTVPKYTVTFMSEGAVYMEASVEEGACVTVEEPRIAGMKFYGWLDSKDQPVDISMAPVRKNVKYFASFYPDLTAHEPYLFADRNH